MRRAWRRWWVGAIVYAVVLTPPASSSWARTRPKDGGPLPTIAGIAYESRIQPDLTRVAREMAGKGEVRCWSETDWPKRTSEFVRFNHWRLGGGLTGKLVLGYVSPDKKRINLPSETCNLLAGFIAGDPPDEWIAYAARILAHETWHLKGEESELKASCYGLQTVRALARSLGASSDKADELAALAWDHYLRRPGCYDGGALDLRPDSPVWP